MGGPSQGFRLKGFRLKVAGKDKAGLFGLFGLFGLSCVCLNETNQIDLIDGIDQTDQTSVFSQPPSA